MPIWNGSGDDDIANMLRNNDYVPPTYDAVSIEFDAISTSDKISFQYIFASEEFDQKKKYNDAFALYVNGENIAKIPEGGDDYVSMVSLRSRHPEYYYEIPLNRRWRIESWRFFNFLGYTSLLSCQATVTPGAVNKMKLVIADVGDPYYDSAILIKANSISSQHQPPMEENPHPLDPVPEPDPAPVPEPNPDPGQEPAPEPRLNISIEKDVSKVELTTADGRVLHSIQLQERSICRRIETSIYNNR